MRHVRGVCQAKQIEWVRQDGGFEGGGKGKVGLGENGFPDFRFPRRHLY
jgi:hypothetical protein